MARQANLSLLGLYKYDPELFEQFVCPDELEKDDLIDTIVLNAAELEILYTDSEFMKYLIGVWSRGSLHRWQKMTDVMLTEYNPIWNKDGTVTETENTNATNTLQTSGTGSSTDNKTVTGSNTHQVAAFNSDALTDANSDDYTQSDGDIQSSQVTGSSNEQKGEIRSYTRTEQGNIGVTTTQQMISEEMNLRIKYNIYEIIAEEFKTRFCLGVY